MFKAIGALIHIPLLEYFTKLIKYLIPDSQTHQLGISNLTDKTDYHTTIIVLKRDVTNFYEQSQALIQERYANPQNHNTEQYYVLRTQYDALFAYIVSFGFMDKQIGILYITVIQESIQALKMCKDSMHTMNKIITYNNPYSTQHLHTIQSII